MRIEHLTDSKVFHQTVARHQVEEKTMKANQTCALAIGPLDRPIAQSSTAPTTNPLA